MSDSNSQSNKRKHFSTSSSSPQQELPKRSRQGPDGTTPTTTVSPVMANPDHHQPVGAAIFDEPVSYLDLKAWIAEQEALPQPEPLTDVQKRAILDLKKSIVRTKTTFDIEDADWVSLLHSKSVPWLLGKVLLINFTAQDTEMPTKLKGALLSLTTTPKTRSARLALCASSHFKSPETGSRYSSLARRMAY